MSPTTPHGYPYPLGTDRLADGDDVMRDLAQAIDTRLGVYAAGVVTPPIVAAGANANVAVTFPVGRFPATPAVLATPRATNPNNVRATAAGATATGVTIYGGRDSGTAVFDVMWLAVLAP